MLEFYLNQLMGVKAERMAPQESHSIVVLCSRDTMKQMWSLSKCYYKIILWGQKYMCSEYILAG